VPEIEIPYEPRPQQRVIHDTVDAHPFTVAVCHRRMGKTVAAVNQLIKAALTSTKKRPQFAIMGPTYTQQKRNCWHYLQEFTAKIPGVQVNHSELSIRLPHAGGSDEDKAQISIYGSDNPDAMRGIYLDGLVLDEFQDHAPNLLTQIVMPLRADRLEWVLILGTPNGKNSFYEEYSKGLNPAEHPGYASIMFKASETGIVPVDILMEAQRQMSIEEYAQEYECSFDASVKGAIYARELATAHTEGRITHVPYDPELPVDTDWDLGIGDQTCIWFTQSLTSGEIRVIDYYEAEGKGLNHYVKYLKELPYVYGTHFAPHDIKQREFTSGKTRLDSAAKLGLHLTPIPRVKQLEDGIHAVRMVLPKCWFDAKKCREGLDALSAYRRDYNARIQEHTPRPVHDWASHAADAFRGLATRHHTPKRLATPSLRAQQFDPDPFRWAPTRTRRGGYR
jgi:phage terminase large subunit